jgi:hypothetical protein
MVAAAAIGRGSAIVVKLALNVFGALASLAGVVILIVGCLAYARLPVGADADALFGALDAIAIGVFGALIGASLIVYAGRAPRRGAPAGE